ncbi:MAG TPA: GGDEF domain-containing protein [Marmoricola sp.]|nr:GGDEF domain-containing protein [Marmoricola sp.]
MTGRRTAYAASLSVALVLLGLAVATAVGILAIMQANQRVTDSRALITAHLAVERAVAAEAAAEAGYRRAPSHRARALFERGVVEVHEAVDGIPTERDGDELKLPSLLTSLNARYVGEVRRTLDTPARDLGEDIVAGPALQSMQELLDDEVTWHRAEARRATEAQEVVLRWLAIVLPAVFLLAFALLGFGLRRMLLDQRRLRIEAAHSRSLAATDPLTGLANRSHLEVVMKDVLARPRTPGALLYLDLDRFKPVNDLLGHHAGDLVLVEVARRLRETVRAGATVARIGGDEFVVVLPECATPRRVATRIVEAIEAPIEIDGHEVSVGTSIGIAVFPGLATELTGLLQAADAALYDAKRAGRGGIVRAAPQPAASTSSVTTARGFHAPPAVAATIATSTSGSGWCST